MIAFPGIVAPKTKKSVHINMGRTFHIQIPPKISDIHQYSTQSDVTQMVTSAKASEKTNSVLSYQNKARIRAVGSSKNVEIVSKHRFSNYPDRILLTEVAGSMKHRIKSLKFDDGQFYQVKLSIEDNWGDPNQISISSVDFLDDTRTTMKVNSVAPLFDQQYTELCQKDLKNKDGMNFGKLYDQTIIKQNFEDTWHAPWSSNQRPIQLIFTFYSPKPPEEIRIWNSPSVPRAGVRKASVYVGNDFITKLEIPCGFGCVSPLKTPEFPYPITPVKAPHQNRDQLLKDKFGCLKIPEIYHAKLTVLSTFAPTSPYVGLTCVEFFDVNGKEIRYSTKSSFSPETGIEFGNPDDYLDLNGDHHVNVRLINDSIGRSLVGGWIGSKYHGQFELNFEFHLGAQIALMRIHNYMGNGFNSGISVKNVKITGSGKVFYIGTLKNQISDIWFLDPDILEHDPKRDFVLASGVSPSASRNNNTDNLNCPTNSSVFEESALVNGIKILDL